MISFQPIKKSDLETLKPYFPPSSRLCTKAIGVMYMWSEYCETRIAPYEGGVLFKDDWLGFPLFRVPKGENAETGFALIEEYLRARGEDIVFHTLDDEDLALLSARYPVIEIKSRRDNDDYLYLASDLAEYKGKKYHGQRNFRNRFFSTYPNHTFAPFGAEDLPEIYAFLEEHKALAPRSKEELNEYECCRRLLDAMEELPLLTAVLRVDGKIVAMGVGEKLGDTLIIHIEKALASYVGVYPTFCSLFASFYGKDVTYINREDDAGDPGLRISKTQYNPVEMLPKRMAVCHLSRPLSLETIFTDRLVIDSFAASDMNAYAALATDEERNRYWGYDYKIDLGSDEPNAAHFARVLVEDEGRGVCYSRKIEDYEGNFVGEAVLYNFRLDGSAELGLRVSGDKAGKGYGREAYRAVAEEALRLLPALHARCFKANARSKKMILAAGFSLVREDDEMYYFKRTR